MGKSPQFPPQANGWQSSGDTKCFDRSNVFTYMNGAGELYLAYDFQRVHVREYTREGQGRIVAEAYEMTSSQDAYGVFSHDPEGEDVEIGQGNAYAAGLLRMWQGPWFYRILAERETPEAKVAVLEIARTLTQSIGDGPLPLILDRLPTKDRDAASIRYFHTKVSLDSIYYLADDNILDLSPRTDAVMCAYRPKGEKLQLLVVRYKNSQQAEAAYGEFSRVYLKDKAPPQGLRRVETIEQGRQIGVLVQDSYLALVVDAKSPAACERLLSDAAARLR